MAQWTSLLPTLVRSPERAAPAAALLPLQTGTCLVGGRKARYGVVEGDGPTVLFFHGWGLSHRCYVESLRVLGSRGWRVIALDLPGFGGTCDLPASEVSFASFASFAGQFLDELGVSEQIGLVGHSFGGGVAVRFAHDFPQYVRALVLLDAVSGATWVRSSARSQALSTRPLWDWGIHLLRELPGTESPAMVSAIVREVGTNLVRHPATLGLAADLARRSDLRVELAGLEARGLRVRAVWGERDRVVTRASFDDQCRALGTLGDTVPGSHAWPMSEPARFADVVADALGS